MPTVEVLSPKREELFVESDESCVLWEVKGVTAMEGLLIK